MGGDHAPDEVVKGAVLAARQLGVEVLLVGDQQRLEPVLERTGWERVRLLHAPDVVAMDAHPLEAVRKQKTSSIRVAAAAVKSGEAAALVSAGNTGASMAAAVLGWGRIPGIDRPAIGTVLPTLRGKCLLLDAGAQVDARPRHLVHFAMMGSIYAERVLGLRHPRVGLLSIGEEETKGNEQVLEVHRRLKQLPQLNFVGNIEGRDVLPGQVDVVVCDGFVGNIVLKFTEGMARTIFGFLKTEMNANLRSRAGALLMGPALRNVKGRLDYTQYGGAPLLGVNGVCVISHGSSNATAIYNAVRVAKEAVEQGMVKHIATAISSGEWNDEAKDAANDAAVKAGSQATSEGVE